jgi:hypothetical protein
VTIRRRCTSIPYDVSSLVLPRSPELDRLVDQAFVRLEAALPFDRLAFARASGEDEVEIIAIRQEGVSRVPPGTRIRYSEAIGADVVMSGLAIVVDVGGSPLLYDRKVAADGIRQVLRVPVGREGLVAGAMTVARREGEFTPSEIAAATVIAEGISEAVLTLAHEADPESDPQPRAAR